MLMKLIDTRNGINIMIPILIRSVCVHKNNSLQKNSFRLKTEIYTNAMHGKISDTKEEKFIEKVFQYDEHSCIQLYMWLLPTCTS